VDEARHPRMRRRCRWWSATAHSGSACASSCGSDLAAQGSVAWIPQVIGCARASPRDEADSRAALMSTWEQITVGCPSCGASLDVKVARGLHISRLPAVRERVARGELHRFVCASCHQTIEVRRPLVYTDFERGHWIEVRVAQDIARWPELAPACAAL